MTAHEPAVPTDSMTRVSTAGKSTNNDIQRIYQQAASLRVPCPFGRK